MLLVFGRGGEVAQHQAELLRVAVAGMQHHAEVGGHLAVVADLRSDGGLAADGGPEVEVADEGDSSSVELRTDVVQHSELRTGITNNYWGHQTRVEHNDSAGFRLVDECRQLLLCRWEHYCIGRDQHVGDVSERGRPLVGIWRGLELLHLLVRRHLINV